MKPSKKKQDTETKLKILTPNKSFARLPILLPQIEAENNSYKLKTEIMNVLYLLYERNNITKKFTTFN